MSRDSYGTAVQPHLAPRQEDISSRFPHAPTQQEIEDSRPQLPASVVFSPSPVHPERHEDAPEHGPTASNESPARWIRAPASQGPRPQPDTGPVTVTLVNATRTSGGSGPGPVRVPAAEAASLLRTGLARPGGTIPDSGPAPLPVLPKIRKGHHN